MKRFIVFLLVILMIVPLCGCMGGEEETTTPSPTTTAPTTAVPPTESPEKSYSMLQINEVNESNNKIIVRGVSDLPDGSSLIVGVELAGLAPSDTWIGTSDKTTVQDGSFEIELDVLNHPKFANGPLCCIRVVYTKKSGTSCD